MSSTGIGPSGAERLAAARQRAVDVAELLDLADAAIEEAVAARDGDGLRRIADELDAAAGELGPEARGLRVAAARARAVAPGGPRSAPVEPRAPLEHAPPSASPPETTLAYAGWVRRVGAFAVDWTLLWFLLWIPAEGVSSFGAFLALYFGVPMAYFASAHAWFGRTVGKLLLGIDVRAVDGGRVRPEAAVGRALTQALLVVTVLGFFLDSLWPLWDPAHQTLHDKAAKTIVLHRVGHAPEALSPTA